MTLNAKNLQDFTAILQRIYAEKLQTKTGWGKNELIVVFKDVCLESVLEYLSKGEARK